MKQQEKERGITITKVSEAGRTGEDLVQKISKLLLDYTKEHYESTVMLDCNYLAAEIIKLTPNIPTYYPYDTEMFQELFNYMAGEHNVTLLESEMDDIMRICLKIVGGKFAPSSKCQENHSVDVSNMVSKEVMFDFVRWLREADRFNGGQSLKMVYEQFKNNFKDDLL